MKALRLLLCVLGVLVLSWAAGFLYFVHGLSHAAPRGRMPADGIVVLTGGPDRIGTGLTLLRDHPGARMLISGVNPETRRADLARHFGALDLFACCIDIGYRASNTEGNAIETARWAAAHGYRSLVVVTSAGHMPRGLAEMQRAMPEARLIPHPVVPAGRHAASLWEEGRAAGVLAGEYSKYLVSLARMRLGVPAQNI